MQKMLNGNIFSQREPEKVEGEDARLMYHVVVVVVVVGGQPIRNIEDKKGKYASRKGQCESTSKEMV